MLNPKQSPKLIPFLFSAGVQVSQDQMSLFVDRWAPLDFLFCVWASDHAIAS